MTKLDTTPKKDVIYVDIEDDITSVIEKVKGASSQIVALVPPKRIGALQSIVNLKLLQRAAGNSKKRVVLITNDHALTALAAGLSIPIAKNLQSKPEIAQITALNVDDEEVIDGESVVVDAAAAASSEDGASESVSTVHLDTAAALADKLPKKSAVRVPNFDAFRNKLALIVGGGLLLIGGVVWAVFFAPRADVTITAKTTPYGVNKILSATAGEKLNAESGILPVTIKEIQKTASVDFTPTGKKDVGERATGQVKLTRQSLVSTALAAGTTLTTSGGLDFKTDAAATIPASTVGGPGCFPTACPGTVTVAVSASERGTKYNTATGALTGAPAGVTANFVAPASGGTDKTVAVVSEQDATAARDKIQSLDSNNVKAELKKLFSADMVIVEESFVVTPGNPVVSPAVDQEATAAKLTIETKYTMIGLSRSDVRSIIEKDLTKQIAGLPNQSVYDQGMDRIRFTSYSQTDKTFKVNVQTTAYVGPSIDSGVLAKQLVGKREGEIQQIVKAYEGIRSVDVRFSPFWVSTAPSQDKITIKFQIENANN